MTKLSKKDSLRDAALLERLRMVRVKWRYAALSKKMDAYSEGAGDPPTGAEYQQWIEDGRELERLKALALLARNPDGTKQ